MSTRIFLFISCLSYVNLSRYQPVQLFTFSFFQLFNFPSILLSLPTCPSVYLSYFLSVRLLPFHLRIYLPSQLSIHLRACVSIYSLFTCLPVNLSPCPAYCLSIHLPLYPSTCPPIYLSNCLPVQLSTCKSVSLFCLLPIYSSTSSPIYLFTYLPAHLSTCPPVYLCIYLPPLQPPPTLPLPAAGQRESAASRTFCSTGTRAHL